MITTDRFVFLHLHKSGGTFVNECLLRFLPDARRVGYHLPRHLIPQASASLPVLGLVRNPWSYYVSWYAFQATRSQPNLLFRVLSEDGRLGFAATIRNMLDLGGDSKHLDRLLAELPAAYGSQGINLPGFALSPIRGTGLGFYSYLYGYLFGAADVRLRLGRMESMRQELPRMLEGVGQPVGIEMREFIEHAAPRNAGAHAPYTESYDDEMREQVFQRDAALIAQYGFRFGD